MDSGKLIKDFMENTVKGFNIIDKQLRLLSESNIRLIKENKELREKIEDLEEKILLVYNQNGD